MKLCALLSCLFSVARASDDFKITNAYTAVTQASDDGSLEESTTGSADLLIGWSPGRGRLDIYIEGNSSLRRDGVATRLPRSNADAATALDPDRSGRIQVSELKYSYTWQAGHSVAGGLIDPSAYIDATRINNDENLQFLGASFVNNPTIEFPDYTLGVATHLPGTERGWKWNLVLAGSNGIADNPNLSYSQLLSVSEHRKGVFAVAETVRESDGHRFLTGAWLNTADHATFDGTEDGEPNYGIYAAAGKSLGAWAANLRLGVADPDVSLTDKFAAISVQWERREYLVGLALARSWISTVTTPGNANHSVHAEGYLRVKLHRDLYLTPSIQYLTNGGYDSSATLLDKDTMVYSLRLHYSIFNHP